MTQETVVIIDSNNTLYRMFHTQPALMHSGIRVESAKAAYNHIVSFAKKSPFGLASKLIAVFDAPGDNFRHEISDQYKINRNGMPPELKTQEDVLRMGLAYSGISVVSKEGYEADDTIGMIANYFEAKGYRVVIVANDKDMMQLINDNIQMYNPVSKKLIGYNEVIEATGVTPDLIADYLAIMGDQSDNIIGVEGAGPKTAAKWLAAYGDLNGVIENADKIKGVVGASLSKAKFRLCDNLNLTTIRHQPSLLTDAELIEIETPNFNDSLCRDLTAKTGIGFGVITYSVKPPEVKKVTKPDKKNEGPEQASMF